MTSCTCATKRAFVSIAAEGRFVRCGRPSPLAGTSAPGALCRGGQVRRFDRRSRVARVFRHAAGGRSRCQRERRRPPGGRLETPGVEGRPRLQRAEARSQDTAGPPPTATLRHAWNRATRSRMARRSARRPTPARPAAATGCPIRGLATSTPRLDVPCTLAVEQGPRKLAHRTHWENGCALVTSAWPGIMPDRQSPLVGRWV